MQIEDYKGYKIEEEDGNSAFDRCKCYTAAKAFESGGIDKFKCSNLEVLKQIIDNATLPAVIDRHFQVLCYSFGQVNPDGFLDDMKMAQAAWRAGPTDIAIPLLEKWVGNDQVLPVKVKWIDSLVKHLKNS